MILLILGILILTIIIDPRIFAVAALVIVLVCGVAALLASLNLSIEWQEVTRTLPVIVTTP